MTVRGYGLNIPRMAAQSLEIGTLLGHYRITERIGQGGMGVVFKAHDQRLDREVAVKILPPDTFPNDSAKKRFRREARVLAKLSHPNVAMAFDFGEQDGLEYLVTEYVGGISLDTQIVSGPLDQKVVAELGVQLANGLEAAHREHIIHSDLKPHNLRLTADGHLKILDFGLARWREPVYDTAKTLSQEPLNIAAGTLPYMAPEQIRGEESDFRTDIWGAGTVLYELATGQRPFAMVSTLRLIDAVQHSDPVTPSQLNKLISPAFDAIVLKSLDKDPDRRYQSARELAVDLLRLLPASEANRRLAVGDVVLSKNRSRLTGWFGLAVFMLVSVYGVFHFLRHKNSEMLGHNLLVVLPFTYSEQGQGTEALFNGLNDTVTARLARTQAVEVISARDAREQGVKTPDEARKEFGADLVLECNAHTAGDELRLNCSLVDSKTHRQLVARTITANINDVFGLEDQVSSEMASLLSGNRGEREQTSTHDESNPQAYASYLRGRGYLSEYQKPESLDLAVAEFTEAIALDPTYPKSYAALGQSFLLGYEQENRGSDWIVKAQNNCQKSLAVKETAEGRVCLGGVYNLTGKYDLAVQEFQRAVQLDPSNEDGLHGEAEAYVRLGNPTAAEAAYKKAITLRPNYWGVYSWLGTFYYGQSRYDEAISEFKRVIDLAPQNYRGYSNLGAMYVAQGKYALSLEPLNKSIEIRPNLEALNNLGNAYFALRRYSDAVDAFQRGLNLDDNDWLLWGNLGDALFWNGDHARAKKAYGNAIAKADKKLEVNPKDATVLAFLADYHAMNGEHQKAIGQIEQALSMDPKDGEVRLRAAIVYNQLGDENHCLTSLENAVQLGYSKTIIQDTPDFDHMRDNMRFKALLHAK